MQNLLAELNYIEIEDLLDMLSSFGFLMSKICHSGIPGGNGGHCPKLGAHQADLLSVGFNLDLDL